MKLKALSTVSSLVLSIVALLLVPVAPVFAEVQECNRTGQSTEDVFPDVTLTWDSSFHCFDAPDPGKYMIVVNVTNSDGNIEAVTIKSLELKHTTPRPRGQAPDATANAMGLPMTVNPNETKRFGVTGAYELVETDEGKKANLHLRAKGEGAKSTQPFELGINVHLREATE